MRAPPIDKRSYSDIVAWTEQLARCQRVVPGVGLVGAILDQAIIDSSAADPQKQVIANAGTCVDQKLAEAIGRRRWLNVGDLLAGTTLPADIADQANGQIYKAGTLIDARLAAVLEDLARIIDVKILIGCTLGKQVDDPDAGQIYKAGTVIDADLAQTIARLAWVTIRSWQPRSDGQLDAGQALIRLFGRFAALVVDRINRAPEKYELAFLNVIGTQPLPPQPARVPLTFTLVAGSPVDAVIPAGTQVAASLLEGEDDEVIFATERNLVVSRAQLVAVYVGDVESDTYSNRSKEANGSIDQPFAAFAGDIPVPHQLFLACDQLLLASGEKSITLALKSPDEWQWNNWPISWAYWDGVGWSKANATAEAKDGAWRVKIEQLPPLPTYAINQAKAGWLRAQLDMRLASGRSGLAPESVVVGNRQPQELSDALYPFGETSAVKWFYLSADEALAAERAPVTFKVDLARRGVGANVVLNWSYKVGSDWRVLGQSSAKAAKAGASDFDFSDGTQAFTRDGEISFYVPQPWPREFFRSRIGRWLRVEIVDAGAYTTLPQIRAITVSYGWKLPRVTSITAQLSQSLVAQPLAAFFNTGTLDLSKDFYPFGEQPRFNDTLYLACPDALARPGAKLKLSVLLTNPAGSITPPAVLASGNPQIAWEVWDGRAWSAVNVDKSYALTASGDLTFTLPATIARAVVNGEEHYWLRARLVGGHYGEAARYRSGTRTMTTLNTAVTPPVKTTETTYAVDELVAETYAPPVIKSLSVESPDGQPPALPPSACLSYNDFGYVDYTAVAATGEAGPFTPFTTTVERDPAIYLGFDQAFDPRPATLYLQLEPPLPEEVAADQLADLDPTTLAQVTWEYASSGGWRTLGALDETRTMSSRGLISFVGPRDFVKRSCFGQRMFWARARWHRGSFPLPPRLRRVLLNTTWASQVVAIENEILGSSNGNPGQIFVASQTPVQPAQQLLVRERELPPPAEAAALVALEGADAIAVTQDATGQPDEIWVRWHARPDFYQSGPRDRHYTVDPLTGELRFGDGLAGLIPPVGQNNIRITYRAGGGLQGNRASGTIAQLKSGIPYIDGVINYEPAQGGSDQEPIERLKARGPSLLRHRNRAITAQDLEDLAYAASTDVARAAAIAPAFDPNDLWLDPKAPAPTERHDRANAGRMGVIVVPNEDAARPAPSLGLLREVQAHLQARCPPTADLWVAGPEWVCVTVNATIVPTSLEVADLVGVRVRAALDRFIHPLTGGVHRQGWAFGRKPHRSDLFALIESVAGVDHVQSLAVAHAPETRDPIREAALKNVLDQSLAQAGDQPPSQDLRRWLDRALVYSGQHEISIALAT
jgi:hypothetical protein